MRPLRSLLIRIPDSRVRRIVTFASLFAISLLVGRMLEIVLHPDTLKGMHAAQKEWIAQVRALTPLGLANGYLGDLDAALNGAWIYEDTSARDAAAAASLDEMSERRMACSQARVAAALGPSCVNERMTAASVSASACTVNASLPGCDDYLACTASAQGWLFATPPECLGGDSSMSAILAPPPPASTSTSTPQGSAPHPVFVPVIALLHGATRLASNGPGAILLALFQIGVGFFVLITLTPLMSKTKEAGFGNALANCTLGPIAVIALGSLVALAMQGLMLGALYAFSWATGFAAGAAGATGVAGACWWCFTKLTERGVEASLTK